MQANVEEELDELELYPQTMGFLKDLVMAIVEQNRMGLSPQELDLIKMKMDDYSNKSIGEELVRYTGTGECPTPN